MITVEKIATIKKRVKNGEPAGELRAELERDGFTKEEIAACFPAHAYNMRGWYLFFGVVLMTAAVILFSLLLAAFAAILYALYYNEKKKAERKKADDIVAGIGSESNKE